METKTEAMKLEIATDESTQWCWTSPSKAYLETVRVDVEGKEAPHVECIVGSVPVAIVKPKARGGDGEPWVFALPKPIELMYGSGVRVRVKGRDCGGINIEVRL